MNNKEILDLHQQARNWSCFQMAPELALKLARLIDPTEYPFQNQPWDRMGYEPYRRLHKIGKFRLQFSEQQFAYPYTGLKEKLQEEIDKRCYPVVSLEVAPNIFHGFVVVEAIGNNDFVILSKSGSLESGNCKSRVDTLDNYLSKREKVDCLFWQATIES